MNNMFDEFEKELDAIEVPKFAEWIKQSDRVLEAYHREFAAMRTEVNVLRKAVASLAEELVGLKESSDNE